MELLRADVQRRLFRTTGYNFRRLLVLLYVLVVVAPSVVVQKLLVRYDS
jgi:hypothetical protein